MVVAGAVPAIVADQLTGSVPPFIVPTQLAALTLVLIAGARWRTARSLRPAVVVLIGLAAVPAAQRWLLGRWPASTDPGGPGFPASLVALQASKLLIAAAMIGVLLLLGKRPPEFFLAVGSVSGRIRPVRALGFPRPDPWWRFGLIWGGGIAAVLAVAFGWSGSAAIDGSLMSLLPAIVVLAAVNSFTEEMTYRAPLLATLEPVIGSGRAVWLAAVYFGVRPLLRRSRWIGRGRRHGLSRLAAGQGDGGDPGTLLGLAHPFPQRHRDCRVPGGRDGRMMTFSSRGDA